MENYIINIKHMVHDNCCQSIDSNLAPLLMKENSKEGVSFILESQTPTCGILKECINYET